MGKVLRQALASGVSLHEGCDISQGMAERPRCRQHAIARTTDALCILFLHCLELFPKCLVISGVPPF